MDGKRWLPLAAAVMVGSHLISRRAARMREGMVGARAHAGTLADMPIGSIGPSRLWSSASTRAIHLIEESTMAMVMALFVTGVIAIGLGL